MSDTLLGVPHDVLLRAMEICPVRMFDGEVADKLMQQEIFFHNGLCKTRAVGSGHHTSDWVAYELTEGRFEHVFRERLVGKNYSVLHGPSMTVIRSQFTNIQIENPHHLTALALAVVKIGNDDA